MSLMLSRKTRRGDTLIEVMVAIAVLALVTIVTVSMMQSGITAAERSLELTTARNELNAQAEALRFVHSSYVAELALPPCESSSSERCQAFAGLWDEIVGSTISATEFRDRHLEFPATDCANVYGQYSGGNIITDGSNSLLSGLKAFVINTRKLGASNQSGSQNSQAIADSFVPVGSTFTAPDLSARILYTDNTHVEDTDENEGKIKSLTEYTRIAAVQGLWVIGVRSDQKTNGQSDYFDFHIETCWNSSGSKTPSSLDAVIRLYNPAARN